MDKLEAIMCVSIYICICIHRIRGLGLRALGGECRNGYDIAYSICVYLFLHAAITVIKKAAP